MTLCHQQTQRTPFHILLASALGSMFSTIITNPIEVRKLNQHIIPITCPEYPLKCESFIEQCLCNSNTLRHQLFSGLSVVIPQILVSNAIFIQLYQLQRSSMLKTEIFKERSTLATVLSASCARFITSAIIAPVEAKRVRMSSRSDSKALLSTKQKYSSLKITVQRDVLFSVVCWSIIENLRNRISGAQYRSQEKSKSQIWGLNMLPGFVGGICAAIVSNPIDVVKTRIQSRSLSSSSTWKQVAHIYRNEGLKGLCLGMQMRVLKTSLHLSFYLTVYESLLNFLKDSSHYE